MTSTCILYNFVTYRCKGFNICPLKFLCLLSFPFRILPWDLWMSFSLRFTIRIQNLHLSSLLNLGVWFWLDFSLVFWIRRFDLSSLVFHSIIRYIKFVYQNIIFPFFERVYYSVSCMSVNPMVKQCTFCVLHWLTHNIWVRRSNLVSANLDNSISQLCGNPHLSLVNMEIILRVNVSWIPGY